ncbi:MAG: C39 family peptidase [Candidatus Rokuibacteriota bacterium]
MLTDLFAVASAIDVAAVEVAIPPSCRRGVVPAPPVTRDGADAVVELGPWRPRHPARHLVPSLSPLERACRFRFEASVRAPGGWSPWVATTTVGGPDFPPPLGRGPGLEAHVDYWRAPVPVGEVRLRVRCDDAAALRGPWLATLSASDLAPGVPPPGSGMPAVRLDVPAVSQMAEGGEIGARICSPASVAMVLAYWGRRVDVRPLARDMLHAALDLYGVWPAAIRAAARRGVLGYLMRFPDWPAAAWCLARAIPIIASVRYAPGELPGAAIPATPGHLLVLTGYEDDHVYVNDPAANTRGAVKRRYRLTDLARVWLDRSGVGYVLFDPTST